MCQRAYFSFNLMAKENQIKSLEADAQKATNMDGQVETTGGASPGGQPNPLNTNLPHTQSQASQLDSVLDASVHVGTKDKIQDNSLTKLDLLAQPRASASGSQMANDGEYSKMRKTIEDLQWKINYEQ